MNASSQSPCDRPALVIGYGSTLRGDDGVGPRVAELIGARCLSGVEVIACHQLTPELADPISKARVVVFVDAALDLPDDKVRVSSIQPKSSRQVMVHTTTPEVLLHLAEAVFGFSPAAFMVAVPVQEMGISDRLSRAAERAAGEAVECVVRLICA